LWVVAQAPVVAATRGRSRSLPCSSASRVELPATVVVLIALVVLIFGGWTSLIAGGW
jgi:hypothetical protein